MAGINLGPTHDLAIRLQKMQDQIDALSTRDVLQNANIGAGGLSVSGGGGITITSGGSLTVTGTGSLNVAAGGLNSAGSITAATTVNAGTDVNASGNVNVSGVIKSPATYSNPITTSYRAVWVTSVDGQFGYNLSSREFKTDIEDFRIDPALALRLRVVTFRYIQAVERYGPDAATEIGLIAEEVDELGLDWLVDYDPDTGRPSGIRFHLLALAALAVLQDHESRLLRLERKG